MVAVPAAPPVTTPDEALTVAMPVLLLVQVPPLAELLRAVVCPWQTTRVPVIGPGIGLTVSTAVLKQPVGNV